MDLHERFRNVPNVYVQYGCLRLGVVVCRTRSHATTIAYPKRDHPIVLSASDSVPGGQQFSQSVPPYPKNQNSCTFNGSIFENYYYHLFFESQEEGVAFPFSYRLFFVTLF